MSPSFAIAFAFVAIATAKTVAPFDTAHDQTYGDLHDRDFIKSSEHFSYEFPQNHQQYYGLNNFEKTYPHYNKYQTYPEHFEYRNQYPQRGYQDVDVTFDVINKKFDGPIIKAKIEKVVYGVKGVYKQQEGKDDTKNFPVVLGDYERPEYFQNRQGYRTPVEYEHRFEHNKDFPYYNYNKHQVGRDFDYDQKYANHFPTHYNKYQTPQTPFEYERERDFPYYNKYQTDNNFSFDQKLHRTPVDYKYREFYKNDVPYYNEYQIPGKYEHDFEHQKRLPTFDKYASYMKHQTY